MAWIIPSFRRLETAAILRGKGRASMNVRIFYHSQTGNTRKVAAALGHPSRADLEAARAFARRAAGDRA